MGNTYGHVSRSLALSGRLPEHEFLFVGGGRLPGMVEGRYRCHEVPVLRTVHRNQAVDIPATIRQIVSRVAEIPKITRGLADLIEEWQPDLAICDREFFLPMAARKKGLRCVSINHSHLLTSCRYPVPASERLSWLLAMINDKILFDRTKENFIVSFYHPELKRKTDEMFDPVLREPVLRTKRERGEKILVYQTSPTFHALIETLHRLKREVIVYGFRQERVKSGNVQFKPFDSEEILHDLASCSYAVTNGGHNLISEALYLGKPVLCFPIAMLFEQFLNSYYIRKMGYGDYSTSKRPSLSLFEDFERNLETYRRNVESRDFDGTGRLIQRIRSLLPGGAERV